MLNLTEILIKKYKVHRKYEGKDCLYSKNNQNRYYFFKKIEGRDNDKKATVIMINPSDANYNANEKAEFPDATIQNLYKILERTENFSSFEVVNLYSLIDTNPKDLDKKVEDKLNKVEEELNNEIVKYVLKNAETIIPAWGIGRNYKKKINNILEIIKKNNKEDKIQIVVNHYPSHFAPYCTSINRNPKFEKIKINEIEDVLNNSL